MTTVAAVLFLVALVGYGASTVVYALGLTMGRASAVRAGFYVLLVAAVAHTVVAILHVAHFGRMPLGAFSGESGGAWDHPLATIAWLAASAAVVAGLTREKVRVLGAFLAPVSMGLALGGMLIGEDPAAFLPEQLASTWLPFHSLSNYSSLSFFALAFGCGVLYLIQSNRLKKKKLPLPSTDAGLRMPSLEVLDSLNRKSFALGLAFLTMGILTGTLWAIHGAAEGVNLRPKVVVTLGLWLLYALAWQARSLLGWGGRKAAWIAIVGFAGVIASVVGVAHA